jgi:jumonji domain-containing protein 7
MFPLFADAQPMRVTLRAGEMLFVPVTWWHCVRTVAPSIALNWWWSEPDAEIADVYRHLWGFAAKIADAGKPGGR